MPSVLQLSRYSRLGASSRLRLLDFIPELEKYGIAVASRCLLGDWYINDLYNRRPRSLVRIFAAYWKRIGDLIRRQRYDLVWLEKEALPWLPAGIERTLLDGVPYVMDIDDAWFLHYQAHPSPLVRGLLSGKFSSLVRGARLVIAGNPYLAEWAAAQGARQVLVLPTVIDLARYPTPEPRATGTALVIGWMGSPSTTHYLKTAASGLARCMADARRAGSPLRFIAVGAADVDLPDVAMERVAWSEETEVALLRSFDIGIMPLTDGPWERGKCGYKIIQYMASGCPVVASPVGVNATLLEHGVSGLLADDAGWADALNRLAGNPGLRARMGTAGRRVVEHDYTLQKVAPILAQALLEVAPPSRRVSSPLRPEVPPTAVSLTHTGRVATPPDVSE